MELGADIKQVNALRSYEIPLHMMSIFSSQVINKIKKKILLNTCILDTEKSLEFKVQYLRFLRKYGINLIQNNTCMLQQHLHENKVVSHKEIQVEVINHCQITRLYHLHTLI